jgi:hypothetical protein
MWLNKAINYSIVDEIQALQKAKCQTNDYELIRKYNRKIDLLVDKLYNEYIDYIISGE